MKWIEKHGWTPWSSGDPCGVCGSRDTWWDVAEGAQCNGCGASDADE